MNKAIVLALAVLAAAMLVVAPATTAKASNSYLCESSGSYCVGSAGTAWGDPVVERNPNGREITWVPNGGCYTIEGGCWPTGRLSFYGIGSNTCLVSYLFKAILDSCSSQAVVWYWYAPAGSSHAEFGNVWDSNEESGPLMLSGQDVLGRQYFVFCLNNTCGGSYFQRFDFVNA
jgi:hypothetical protein